MPYRVPPSLALTEAERAEHPSRARRRETAQGSAIRARIVLLAADGSSDTAIAAELATGEHTVSQRRERFGRLRSDEPRSGTPRRTGDEQVAELVDRTLSGRPAGASHWSLRSMVQASGLPGSSVGGLGGAFGLRPNRAETFKLSTDPLFADEVRDIVGLVRRALST